MDNVSKVLETWNSCLVDKVEMGGLYSRNPIAHKWKCTYRSLVLRELVYWRITDLLNQSNFLAANNHLLGARILLRSTIETLGILIYLNQKTSDVTEGNITLNSFSDLTAKLMLGSKNKSTKHNAINVTHTILEKWCERKYPGIFKIYADLCESAHPNYEGVCIGYSYVNEKAYETIFKNRWPELFGSTLEKSIIAFMKIFEHEYNEVWPAAFNELEEWLEKNDEKLEKEMNG